MKRILCLALGLAACGTSTVRVAAGEFTAPSGLAVTSGGDRDILFVANEGRDSLRALQLCSNAAPSDGGVDACPTKEDFQFVPAPIRVFPGTIETSDRPRRLAGVRLSRPDLPGQTEPRTGVVLAVGTSNAVRIVDARNLIEALDGKTAAAPVLSLALPAAAADVVAENPVDEAGIEISAPAGQAATAFVATVAQGAIPAQLLMLSVGVDAQGAAAVPTIVGKCSLGDVLPRKLAVVPGGGDRVYVADGAGDGVVVVAKASIPAPADPPAPCVVDRVSAGNRPVRSVAVSPAWMDATGAAHPAGELLIMVLEPLSADTGGIDLDPGGILIARTADKAIVPIPPFGLFDPAAGPPMGPISTPALAREATFLRAIPPDLVNCPPTAAGAIPGACTPVYVGFPTTAPVAKFNLVAAVTSTNGATYFVDVLQRRFVTTTFYLGTQSPTVTAAATLVPSSSVPNAPTLNFPDPDATHSLPGWVTPGVTPSSTWRVVFHSPMPGLEARSGTLTDSGHGSFLLKLPAVLLAGWASDPALKLAPGDAVSFSSYQAPAGSPQACADLATLESGSPARFELSILSLPAPDTLELSLLQPASTVRGFDLSPCPAGLGVVAAVRAVGDHPWLVYQSNNVRGRAKTGETFVATGRRFDYPLDYKVEAPPVPSVNTAIAFVLGGDEPAFSANPSGGWATWTFALSSSVEPVPMRDFTVGALGVATAVLSYSSPRHPLLVYSSVTGANTVLQSDPAQLNTQTFAYR